MSAKLKARLKKLLAQEKGAVVREWGARWPVALVYPQIYPVAMGNLGFQVIYRLLNASAPDWWASGPSCPGPRSWRNTAAPAPPFCPWNPSGPSPILPPWPFPFLSRPTTLRPANPGGCGHSAPGRRAGPRCPPDSRRRRGYLLNPEPLSPLVDAFFLGRGRPGRSPFFNFWPRRAGPGPPPVLRELAQTVPGAYVPQGYQPRYRPRWHPRRLDPSRGSPLG